MSLVDALKGGSGKNWISEGVSWWAEKAGMDKNAMLSERIYDWVHNVKPEVKNDIKLNITIDKDGRITTESSDSGTDMAISVKRGTFFVEAPSWQ